MRRAPPAPLRPPRGGSGKTGKLKLDPDVSFKVEDFERMIEAKGLTLRWSRCVHCPCYSRESGAANPDCNLCRGRGRWYVHPAAADLRHRAAERDYLEITGVLSSVHTSERRADVTGLVRAGHAELTVGGGKRVGWMDRFVAVDQRLAWTETLVRGSGNEVPIGRTGRTTAEQPIAMRYRPWDIEFVGDAAGTMYFEGTHFDLVREAQGEPGRMVWRDDEGPDEGDPYAVHYVAQPVWLVVDSSYAIQNVYGWPHGIRGQYHLQDLPLTFEVQLEYLSEMEGS